MSISSVIELKGRRSGSLNHLYQRTYKREFRVITTSPNIETVQVRNAVDPNTSLTIPDIGIFYDNGLGTTDKGSYVNQIDIAEEHEDGLSWVVTCSYGPYEALTFPQNPLSWPLKVTWGGKTVEKLVLYDQAGNPILNSAGDPFDEPITIDDSRSSLTVVRNESAATFSLSTCETYRDTLNLLAWNAFALKTVKLGTISAGELQFDSNTQTWYYAVTYPFEINRDGWQRKLLDRGFAYLDGSNKLRRLVGPDGQAPGEPTLLDGTGHQLAHGATPVFISSDVYPAVDWTPLAINLSARLGI